MITFNVFCFIQLFQAIIVFQQVAENLLPESQFETFVELIEDIVKQLRLNPSHSLPLVAHGPPDQSAGGSPVNSRRPRERDHSLDPAKVYFQNSPFMHLPS